MIKKVKNIYHWSWALLANIWYGSPSKKLIVIGITGTKGKTTSAHLIYHLLNENGQASLLSSVSVAIGNKLSPNLTGNTMPGRFFIQKFLRRTVKAGCKYAIVEVTSQGADQHRHRFIKWSLAGFTNLHPEHIEAHGSYKKYREAKLNWFRYVAETNKEAVFFVNEEDVEADKFIEASEGGKVIKYNEQGDNKIEKLKGAINQPNINLAIAIGKEIGLAKEKIDERLKTFTGVTGRMEIIQTEPFTVVIDYAYTPESVELAYQQFKKIIRDKGKIITVFGSAGGGRDKWKRPVLGEIAEKYAEKIILTTEEPYDEKAKDIMEDIRKGIKKEKEVWQIEDREGAIKKAVELAEEGDVIALLGKGAEPYIHQGNKKIPWNEKKITEKILNAPEN